ncbi:cytochrome c oxidase subunit II [Sphingomonas gilva]|uniref:Cytochrome c oxidase subunit 2 n=1 Tax=Sphingomonas gilva TaxID=2305907 RepID=A0A396RPG4_9SPHN|nr:cytochrome c oxidase subunit II [Sphingomonas gilva]RHW18430.1 cytochrome c oxidase subunit II [Sphingomonas gilva]
MRKTGLKSLLLAAGLALASTSGNAQEAAPADTAASAATAAAPDAAAANATAPAAAATPAAPALVQPDPEWGQPIPKGIALPEQVSPNGKTALWFHDAILMPIIVVISLFVLALLVWVVVRYRRSAHPVPSKTTHNTFIEVVWTVIPVLILVIIAVPSIGLLSAQYKPAPADALTIKAIGNQWYWTYQYPDNGEFEITANMLKEKDEVQPGTRFRTDLDGPRLLAVDNRIVVPVGRPIRLITTSNDVIHSWALPAAWVKMDAVPGRLNEVTFQIDRPGVYFGQCSELCGARHAYMPIAVEAVSDAQFNQWVLSKGGTLGGPEPSAPAPTEPDAANTLNASAEATPAPADNVAAPAANTTSQAATANPAGAGNVE